MNQTSLYGVGHFSPTSNNLANMTVITEKALPIGYNWRSSKWFILSTIAIALFAGLSAPIIIETTQH